jgi:hypothetical protein
LSKQKVHISYNNKGASFLRDDIYNDSYTFLFFFGHGDPPPPPLPKDSKEKIPNLLPTAMHVVRLALCNPNGRLRTFINNLFNSRKLFMELFMAKWLTHSVMQTTGHDFPPLLRQLKEKGSE